MTYCGERNIENPPHLFLTAGILKEKLVFLVTKYNEYYESLNDIGVPSDVLGIVHEYMEVSYVSLLKQKPRKPKNTNMRKYGFVYDSREKF